MLAQAITSKTQNIRHYKYNHSSSESTHPRISLFWDDLSRGVDITVGVCGVTVESSEDDPGASEAIDATGVMSLSLKL